MRSYLNRQDFYVDHFERQETRIYGHDVGDLIASAFITELASIGASAIEHKIGFVSSKLVSDPNLFDLSLELDGPRKRMLSVKQPQFVMTIRKTA